MHSNSKVGWLVDQHRSVRARCLVCETHVDVDLAPILAAKGPDFSLANRRPPCRDHTCPGRMVFEDWSRMWPISFDNMPLDTQLAFTDSERIKIEAAGWRLVNGHWHDPQGRAPWQRKR